MYNIPDSGSRDTAAVSRAVTVPLPCRYRDAGCAVPVVVTKLDGPTTQTDPASMEAEIMQLVSEAFMSRHAHDNQQNQLMRNNAAAVREAILAQARPALNPDTPLASGCEPLSACAWKRLSSVLAALMPVFWFSVIKGLWGSVKVNCATSCVLI